jgi:hypothetical protein
MQEGFQFPALLEKIKALREVGLRAEHVAFSFMKRRLQPLMAQDHLGYEYTSAEDTSRMPSEEVNDDVIIERMWKIFKDMPYSAAWPPNEVSNPGQSIEYYYSISRTNVCFGVVVGSKEVHLHPATPPRQHEKQTQGKAGPKLKEH